MKIDYNINNAQKISLVFLGWYPNEKSFEELSSDDFFSIDDITVSESDGVISYSHVEEPQFYKNMPSNLSEVNDKFNFIVEITFERVDYFKTTLVTKDCEDGKYELNLLIKEFLRDSKLDDLGI